MAAPKVFISYSGKDRELAGRLYRDLNAGGAAVFQFDETAVPGTEAWRAILERISDCDYFVVLWSAHSSVSRPVKAEINHAYYCYTNSLHGTPVIIPVIMGKAPALDIHLWTFVQLPFADGNYQTLLDRLGSAVGLKATLGAGIATHLSTGAATKIGDGSPGKTVSRPVQRPDRVNEEEAKGPIRFPENPFALPSDVTVVSESASGNYQILSDGSLRAKKTGLIWEASDDGTAYTHAEAFKRAAKATTHGKTDWRLPTIHEFKNQLEPTQDGRTGLYPDPALNLFDNGLFSRYWSASVDAADADGAWVVHVYLGDVGRYGRTEDQALVRCVRSGH